MPQPVLGRGFNNSLVPCSWFWVFLACLSLSVRNLRNKINHLMDNGHHFRLAFFEHINARDRVICSQCIDRGHRADDAFVGMGAV